MILASGFAALAVIGTLARAFTTSTINSAAFPWGTLAVNITGSFAIGLLARASPELVTVLGVAGLGSFTTFSTLAHETLTMATEKRSQLAAFYLTVTVVAGIGAAVLGLELST